jgi:prepilin-type N-terminal cleavage/methylation domain-containing protein
MRQKQTGFTIVELLIVVVVIAILAAITIVAYSGIRDRAQISSVQSQLSQAMKKVQSAAILNAEVYPATLEEAGVRNGGGLTYQYTSNNAVTPKTFCITATLNQTLSYYISSKIGSAQQQGICPGHNLLVWYEDIAGAPAPINLSAGVSVDNSVQRSGTSSIRFNSNALGIGLRNNPYTIAPGQVITVSLWLKTDSTWNGTGGNSKIRFGDGVSGALISTCPYNGVKVDWTLVTCSFTGTSSNPTLLLTVGNDGTVGQIWIDDLSVSISSL